MYINHKVLLIYILCYVLDSVTILISVLMYRKYRHKAYKYLALLMIGALLSMLVEAIRTFNAVVPENLAVIQKYGYIVLTPVGEGLQLLFLPMLAFAAVGKKFPSGLSLISKVYAFIIIASFPIEVLVNNPIVKLARELAGQFIFNIFSYTVIFIFLKQVTNRDLRKALKSYLVLGIIIVPTAIVFELGIVITLFPGTDPEIPYPYFIHCLLFNILSIINIFKYLFIPYSGNTPVVHDHFFKEYEITEREKEIINLLVQGLNSKKIGEELFISYGTVKNHIYNIYRKTKVKNRVELINKFSQI